MEEIVCFFVSYIEYFEQTWQYFPNLKVTTTLAFRKFSKNSYSNNCNSCFKNLMKYLSNICQHLLCRKSRNHTKWGQLVKIKPLKSVRNKTGSNEKKSNSKGVRKEKTLQIWVINQSYWSIFWWKKYLIFII